MLKAIHVRGFRSLAEVKVDLAPLVVLYGPTGSGKSSLLYAPLLLRNFIHEPNRQADSLFHLGFIHLGGWKDCLHQGYEDLGVSLTFEVQGHTITYGFFILKGENAHLNLTFDDALDLSGKVPLPYPLNQTFTGQVQIGSRAFNVQWNGITTIGVHLLREEGRAAEKVEPDTLRQWLNTPVEVVRRIYIAPPLRGFFRPSYATTSLPSIPYKEEEIATLLLNDIDLQLDVSMYLEKVVGRQFRVTAPVGASMAYFHVLQSGTRTATLLVNDGFGVNQLVYVLTLLLHRQTEICLLEEPEIHLHPSTQRLFVHAMADILNDFPQKQVLLTTHSEAFVAAILGAIRSGKLPLEKVRFYLVEREGRQTRFTPQLITKEGQVEGGLASFIEGELADLAEFLGTSDVS